MTRAALHDVWVDGVCSQAERGQTIGDEVDPQQLNRQQRCRKAHDDTNRHQKQFTRIASQQVLECLANVVVDAPALFYGSDDRGEVVIGDDHVRRLLGDFRS